MLFVSHGPGKGKRTVGGWTRACIPLMIAAWATLSAVSAARADVRLPALLSEGMVLQRNKPVRVWGWADNGEKVTVSIQDKTAEATAQEGKWSVTLPPLTAGGPFPLTVRGRNTITLQDVLVGEVWVASGQSNMSWPLSLTTNSADVIRNANDPQVRFFTVPKNVTLEPQSDLLGGSWVSATPRTAGDFSAVGYHFARSLRQALGVPVGIVQSAWGGTRAETWTDRATLESLGLYPADAPRTMQEPERFAEEMERFLRRRAAWRDAGSPNDDFVDPGVTASAKGWAARDQDMREWKPIFLPAVFERAEPEQKIDGSIWFRREVEIPAAWAGKPLALSLGAIDDFDTTFFNGVQVGATGKETPDYHTAKRNYKVPATLVKPGRAVVAVRVWDQSGDGGLIGPFEEMRLLPQDSPPRTRDAIDLSGSWHWRIETSRPQPPSDPPYQYSPGTASGLFNGMIAPLLPYTIQGAIWFHGEANTHDAKGYRTALPALIKGWRSAWGQGEFPFLIVQLAPYGEPGAVPQDSPVAELREAQAVTARNVPQVGLAVITDIGETDVHSRNKQPVGERLALLARKLAYGEGIVATGPSFRSLKIEGDRAVVSFDNVGGGLEARGGPLAGFAIAGEDGRWAWAEASIDGETVVVRSPHVPKPVAVRYGWADFPIVNLWNKDGLPAAPFRTDEPK